MKRLLVACLLAVLAAPAFAVIGTIDDVPAATLLLPYFEVDLANPNGVTTLMSINNASATAVLAHVIVYTDLSYHVLDFNVYLTGYDVQSINLRDIIVNGTLPRTASAGQDPGDTISNKGPISQDINFASCTGFFPYSNPALDAQRIVNLQNDLTGQPDELFHHGNCVSVDHSDRIARGYVTVDTVNSCSLSFHADAGYFQSLTTTQNVLWGDYFYVNSAENFAQGETLVHIEADAANLGPANYTFYYRYSFNDGVPGQDFREGLGNIFAVRYVDGGDFNGGTSLLVWRDSQWAMDAASSPVDDGFDCDDIAPAPMYPLGQNEVVVFDEEENFETPEGCTISPCPTTEGLIPFPWETQRTFVGSSALPSSYSFGWIFLNLNFSTVAPMAPVFQPLLQNWVSVVMDASGRFSVGYDAIQLGNVTDGVLEDPILDQF